jgi:hypothetical protein
VSDEEAIRSLQALIEKAGRLLVLLEDEGDIWILFGGGLGESFASLDGELEAKEKARRQ